MNRMEICTMRKKMMNRTYLFGDKRFKTEDENTLKKLNQRSCVSFFALNKKNGISHSQSELHTRRQWWWWQRQRRRCRRRGKKRSWELSQMKFCVNTEMSRDFIVHKFMVLTIRSAFFFLLLLLLLSFTVSAFAFVLLSHQRRCRHFDHVGNCC